MMIAKFRAMHDLSFKLLFYIAEMLQDFNWRVKQSPQHHGEYPTQMSINVTFIDYCNILMIAANLRQLSFAL